MNKLSEIDWEKYVKKPVEKKKSGKDEQKDEMVIPLPEKDPGFFNFCKFFAFPRYAGLYKWQKEHHKITWGSKYEETLVPRDHGKSVTYCQKYHRSCPG